MPRSNSEAQIAADKTRRTQSASSARYVLIMTEKEFIAFQEVVIKHRSYVKDDLGRTDQHLANAKLVTLLERKVFGAKRGGTIKL